MKEMIEFLAACQFKTQKQAVNALQAEFLCSRVEAQNAWYEFLNTRYSFYEFAV